MNSRARRCIHCGKTFQTKSSKPVVTCSRECLSAMRSEYATRGNRSRGHMLRGERDEAKHDRIVREDVGRLVSGWYVQQEFKRRLSVMAGERGYQEQEDAA